MFRVVVGLVVMADDTIVYYHDMIRMQRWERRLHIVHVCAALEAHTDLVTTMACCVGECPFNLGTVLVFERLSDNII